MVRRSASAVFVLVLMALPVIWVAIAESGRSPAPSAAKRADRPPAESERCRGKDCRAELVASVKLIPAFSPGISDYVARCEPRRPLTLSGRVPAGTRVSIDGERQSRSFRARVALDPGQAAHVSFSNRSGERSYWVRCLPSDFPRWKAEIPGRAPAGLFSLSPSMGEATQLNYVEIINGDGVPVWWYRADTPTYDGKVLDDGATFAYSRNYNGPYGLDERMAQELIALDDGSHLRTIRALGSPTDHHDFQSSYSPEDYLVTTYKLRETPVDLSRFGGPEQARVADGVFQEIRPDGSLGFSWNSAEHIHLGETTVWERLLADPVSRDGVSRFDPFHINSVDPTPEGWLISARHADAVYMLDRASGAVIWKLGGTTTRESLRVIGDPRSPAPLSGQHDARMLADGTVSIFDNGTFTGEPPRAVRYRINARRGTARLLEQVKDLSVGNSGCCGSSRRLADGSWVIGWGGTSYSGVYDRRGRPQLRLYLPGRATYRFLPVPRKVRTAELRAAMERIAAAGRAG